MKRKYNSGGMMNKMQNYPYVNTRHQMQTTPGGLQNAQKEYQDNADDFNLMAGKKYNMGGYMGVPQAIIPQEGNYSAQSMANQTMLAQPDQQQQMQDGGYMQQMRHYNMGGVQLPGGQMTQIPGSDAVEFTGASHEQGGIMMDPQTEVEGGETMDKVTMTYNEGGGKKNQKKTKNRDYFFSDHLKKDGVSYAQHHKSILANGGTQEDINLLAKMQEHEAGRDPNKVQVAEAGGIKKYEDGGEKHYPLYNGKEMTKRQKDFHDKSIARGMTYVNGAYYKDPDKAKEAREKQGGAQISMNQNPYRKDDPNYIVWENQAKQAEEKGLVYVADPNKAGSGKWVPADEASVQEEINAENKKNIESDAEWNLTTTKDRIDKAEELKDKDNKTSNNKSEIKRDNKYKVASYEHYGDNEGEFGTVPDYQPGYKVDGVQMYAGTGDTPFREALQKEDFRGNWMNNVDPEVLEKAGITSFADMNDPDKVTAYQEAWNDKNPDNKIAVDGKFGEQTFRTGVGSGDDSEDDGTTEEEIVEENETTVVENEELKKKSDWLTPLVMGAQLLPAMYAFKDQPDYMSDHPMASPGAIIPERIAKTHLDRIDMNPERARNASDFGAMNKFIDTSGGGPASMMNKMAAYAKKQQGDRDIAAQEAKANVAISNQEAVMDQQRKSQNVMNALDATKSNIMSQQEASKFNATMSAKVDEFNRGADAATKDRRLNALDAAVGAVAGMNKDRLQYNAQERLAQAISGNTGVYDREGYAQTLVAGGYVPGTEAYTNMMNTYIKNNQTTDESTTSSTSESTTSSKTTTKKKYDAKGNLIDESTTTLKKGGFKPAGFRRRYS
jgi:hypothetical protein